MRIKWKCVWRVLKPKIIAALLVLISGIIAFMSLKYAADVLIVPTNLSQMTVSQATVGTAMGFNWVLIGLIISGSILGYMLFNALAEELKPCLVKEE